MFRRSVLFAHQAFGVSLRLLARQEARHHRKLFKLAQREKSEEFMRDFLPEKPLLPSGWGLQHATGTNRIDLIKEVEIRNVGAEQLHAIIFLESKNYEGTFRMDNGEREEQEYINFLLFVKKLRYPKGGLEFGLTSIDMELVMDSLAIHSSDSEFLRAKNSLANRGEGCSQRAAVERMYRGPMLSELDEDLSDEILDYLDERGVNNAFAEFVMSLTYYYEQQGYLHWLSLLQRFSE